MFLCRDSTLCIQRVPAEKGIENICLTCFIGSKTSKNWNTEVCQTGFLFT